MQSTKERGYMEREDDDICGDSSNFISSCVSNIHFCMKYFFPLPMGPC
jgi:hypothetical protein